MHGLRKFVAALAVATMLIFTGGVAAQAATPAAVSTVASVQVDTVAAPAIVAGPVKPKTYTDTWWHYQWNCMPYPSGAFQWRVHNWWEKNVMGLRDGLVFKHYIYRWC